MTKSKVYCIECEWFENGIRRIEDGNTIWTVQPKCNNPLNRVDTWMERGVSRMFAPSTLNASNDCAWFKEEKKYHEYHG